MIRGLSAAPWWVSFTPDTVHSLVCLSVFLILLLALYDEGLPAEIKFKLFFVCLTQEIYLAFLSFKKKKTEIVLDRS